MSRHFLKKELEYIEQYMLRTIGNSKSMKKVKNHTNEEVIIVEQKYWERFTETGKVEDYLHYKAAGRCDEVAGNHKGETDIESDDCSDRYRAVVGTDWRI